MTKSVLIDDIELRLTRFKPSDDTELERDYISHLIDLVGNQVIATDILDKHKKDGFIDPAYIVKIPCKSPILEDLECVNDFDLKYYVELDFDILPMHDDLGLVRVTTSGGQEFNDVSILSLDNVKYYKLGRASKNNLLRTRQGRKIFLDGISRSFKENGKVIIWAVPTMDYYNSDDDIPFGKDITNIILDEVERKLLRALGIEADLHNDGEDQVEYGTGQ